MQDKWFDDQDKLRIDIGLDYDTTLVKTYPKINDSLAENNQGMCSIYADYFDEDDPEMKPIQLCCGH